MPAYQNKHQATVLKRLSSKNYYYCVEIVTANGYSCDHILYLCAYNHAYRPTCVSNLIKLLAFDERQLRNVKEPIFRVHFYDFKKKKPAISQPIAAIAATKYFLFSFFFGHKMVQKNQNYYYRFNGFNYEPCDTVRGIHFQVYVIYVYYI